MMKILLISLVISFLLSTANVLAGGTKVLTNTAGEAIGYINNYHILNLDRKPIGLIRDRHFITYTNDTKYKAIISNGFIYDSDGRVIAIISEEELLW